jgi:succinate dehydrogenase / fumarate reductase cytochrome b subunit
MKFWNSTIGKKIIVAVTGLVMFGFVIGHLLGNLQVFMGQARLNHYSEFLHEAKELLWGTRILLLLSVVLHVTATVQLNRRNKASRPVPYAQHAMIQASKPSLFMIWSGIFLGLYILYHLSHMTLGWTHAHFSRHNVYANVVTAFSSWPVSLIYILAMVSLGFHLHHGIYSMFQTLGLNHPKYNQARRAFAVGSSVAIAAGYISIPLGVLFGIVRL